MLGTAYLNEICANDIPSPAKILDELKAKITTELSQTGLTGESKDGMDISLARIDLTQKKVEWAGANNPLYIISDNELKEYKPNKQPIGFSDNSELFSNHKISVKSGDSIYLFSDGFADQFGGNKGKKYKYSKFKNILLKTAGLSAEQQKSELKKEFYSWKGSLEQLDDICVIGIKF
jgi:serine phosphatase RsbU (regulator of sigma subunit)